MPLVLFHISWGQQEDLCNNEVYYWDSIANETWANWTKCPVTSYFKRGPSQFKVKLTLLVTKGRMHCRMAPNRINPWLLSVWGTMWILQVNHIESLYLILQTNKACFLVTTLWISGLISWWCKAMLPFFLQVCIILTSWNSWQKSIYVMEYRYLEFTLYNYPAQMCLIMYTSIF